MTTSDLIKDLLEAGVHFGHQTKRWNPKMRRFIFGERSGIYIINLEQTEQLLNKACDFLTEVTARGDFVLFVGTKRQAQPIVREEVGRAEQYYVVNRWLGGMLTNFQTIRKSVDRLHELRALRDDGGLELRSKKEAAQLRKELARLEHNLEGVDLMPRLPGAMFVIDPHREDIAVKEANRLGIPVVAICDTNCDPDIIVYPIPGNDDAMRAIKLLTAKAADACIAGRKQFADLKPVEPIAQEGDAAAADTVVVDTASGDVTVEAAAAQAAPVGAAKASAAPTTSTPNQTTDKTESA